MIINFDNAATTYPKPMSVRRAVAGAVERFGGNSGRGGHALAMRTSHALYSSRETAADFFGAEPENVVFTMNCTYALNMAIRGVMSGGGHLIISSMEHNSAARPAADLEAQGRISLSVARVYPDDIKTVKSFRELIRSDTKAIVCNLASNVTGQLLPWREIAKLCRARNICFIADGAQACGIVPVKLSDGINILCTAGHKGLYGITGTGLLVTDGKYRITPIIWGGTGSASLSLRQPDTLPDSLESGTPCIIGAMSVKAGIEFINRTGMRNIHDHEEKLCRRFAEELGKYRNITVYRDPQSSYVPIVAFNAEGIPSEALADELGRRGFCLRAGYHCAALAHKTLGTEKGALRFAPSVFSREKDTVSLAKTIGYLINSENFKKTIEII